jgi:hypothetical protein
MFELPLLNTVILLSSGVRLKCNKFETTSPTTNKFYSTKVSLPFSSPTKPVLSTKRIGPHSHEVLSILIGSFRSLHLKNKVNSCTALVVWGSNLGSAVGSGRYTKQESENIKLPQYHRSVIVGLLLSDAGLSFSFSFFLLIKKNNKTAVNALLRFSQSIAQHKYFWFVFTILSPFCSKYPYSRTNLRKGIKNYSTLPELYTRTLPCFTELYHLFYLNGKKIIPHNIYELLTPVALAHFIMGDGAAVGAGIRIGTDSFSVKECVQLINVLMIKYRIKCTIHMISGKPRIYIPASYKKRFIQLVKPHMIPSMYYKLGELTSHNLGGGAAWFVKVLSKPLFTDLPFPQDIPYIGAKGEGAIFRAGPHHQDLLSIIFGSLLGIGRMAQEKEGSRMIFCQLKDQREYLIWLRSKVAEQGYCRNTSRIKHIKAPGRGKGYYLSFETFTYTSFNFIREAFYIKNKKVVPHNIGDYLTPLALAVWLMNDGSIYKNKGIKFTANSFRLREVKILSNVLSKNYNLKTSIVDRGVKDEYNIYIPKSSLETLRGIVKPYIHKSMLNKIYL